MGRLAGFRQIAAAIGTWNACLYAGARLLNWATRGRIRIIKYYFTAQPVAPAGASPATATGSFVLDWADADSPLYAQVERPPEVIAARFAQGARCIAATADRSQLAGFLWFVVGPYDEDEVRARFVPKPEGQTAWDFDVLVMPQYRMGRLFGYLWKRAAAELAACGVRQTISRISAFNAASIAAHRRLGARVVGEATFLCAGRWQLMTSSMAPKWHFSWRDDQRPVLEIQS